MSEKVKEIQNVSQQPNEEIAIKIAYYIGRIEQSRKDRKNINPYASEYLRNGDGRLMAVLRGMKNSEEKSKKDLEDKIGEFLNP